MAQDYKFETTRQTVDAELYINDNDTIDFTVPENGVPADYLLMRLRIIQDLVALARKYGLTYFQMSKVV